MYTVFPVFILQFLACPTFIYALTATVLIRDTSVCRPQTPIIRTSPVDFNSQNMFASVVLNQYQKMDKSRTFPISIYADDIILCLY